MAHFAEIDSNNKVLRVVVACNQDIANNGGEQSEQAAEHFKSVCPLSIDGIKWIQTSYNNNFRKQFANKNFIYDPIKDIFISPKPFNSWVLNSSNDWVAPISYPSDITFGGPDQNNNYLTYIVSWDENNLRWIGLDYNTPPNKFAWIPQSSSWVATS
jgi:hypothetical protein